MSASRLSCHTPGRVSRSQGLTGSRPGLSHATNRGRSRTVSSPPHRFWRPAPDPRLLEGFAVGQAPGKKSRKSLGAGLRGLTWSGARARATSPTLPVPLSFPPTARALGLPRPGLARKAQIGPIGSSTGRHGGTEYRVYDGGMVRRDDAASNGPKGRVGAVSRCITPTGESPVPVSAGAPGSRPQVSGGDPCARAGCRKPARRRESRSGEQARGPQHEVKPAASTNKQSGSRAAHVTAKSMTAAQRPERAAGPGGVRGAARVQGEMRNTGDPSRLPESGQGGWYKAKPKSSAAERESEGTVIPQMAVGQNAVGGKGPYGGQVDRGGKREGMAGKTGPNNPRGRRPVDKVRGLQRRLWVAAKRAPGRRFHALY